MKTSHIVVWSIVFLLTGRVPVSWAQADAMVEVAASVQATEATLEPGSIVHVEATDDGFRLIRNGEPYFIYGVGLRDVFGDALINKVPEVGGNSVRTWGVDNLSRILRRAEELDLSVCVGLWLQHERHGFDYSNEERVATQFRRMRNVVRKFRSHPSILMWGIGNETEWFPGTNVLVYKAIDDIAAMIKKEDPHHPTMTVIAELGSDNVKVANVKEHCPNIDILGINSFGGARSLPERLDEAKWEKPYLITEFGALGPWEVALTAWDAPLEQTSTQKADFYRESYDLCIAQQRHRCLGSYAFLWGQRQESTLTWFGMFTRQGEPLAQVDVMQEVWTGMKPDNLAPRIEKIESRLAMNKGLANSQYEAEVVASDPEGGELRFFWDLREESKKKPTMYWDYEPIPGNYPDHVIQTNGNKAVFRTPRWGGAYRLFVYVYDKEGKAATANFPFYVLK